MIAPNDCMTRSKWTQQNVIERIQFLHQQGIPVGKIGRVEHKLRYHCFAQFGSWRSALEAAGLKSPNQPWTPERVIKELKEYQRLPSSCRKGLRNRDSVPTCVVVRFFGSRRAAHLAAGVTKKRQKIPKIKSDWTPSSVIEAIIARHEQGLPLVNVIRFDRDLFYASKKFFGGWFKAKLAAGVAIEKPKSLTQKEIIQILQRRHQQGGTLKCISRDEPKFFKDIVSKFGSLRLALITAGIPTPTFRKWTKRSIIETLRARAENGPPLTNTWKDDRLFFRAAIRHFESWNGALRAAGLKFRTIRRWTKELVIDTLRRSYHGQSFNDVDPNLVAAAFQYFGGFYKAVEAAGLDLPKHKWSKRRIIDLIQEHYIKGLRIEIAGFGDQRLAANAKRYFGTWREAVKAAGLESRLPAPVEMRTWSPDEVLKTICLLAESEGNLAKAWRDTGLYSVAKKHFGTWRKAVRAAGCKPARRRWSQELVVHEIQQRYRKKLPLTSIVFTHDPPLAGAATRLFGNWKAALVAAGIPTPQRPQEKVIS